MFFFIWDEMDCYVHLPFNIAHWFSFIMKCHDTYYSAFVYVVIIPEGSFCDLDILSEFLEGFYIKYGSFIPLSQADVLEYLKKNGNSDLSHRFSKTHTQTHTAGALNRCFTHQLRNQTMHVL